MRSRYGSGVSEHDHDHGPIRRRLSRARDRLRDWPAIDLAYRILVGAVGLALLAVGIVAIPYPGPGWAIVFLGLGVLATEFGVFRRLLKYLRGRYDAAMTWFRRQHPAVRAIATLLTVAVTVATLWLIGAFALLGRLVGWDWAWLKGPLG